MNTTTGAQRHNARQDKIWETYKKQDVKTEEKVKKMIKQYNEEIHQPSGMTGRDLFTLDESEIDEFISWAKKNIKPDDLINPLKWMAANTMFDTKIHKGIMAYFRKAEQK